MKSYLACVQGGATLIGEPFTLEDLLMESADW